MSVRGILAALPYKLKQDAEAEMWRRYMARCVRVIAENTAKLSGGAYIKAEYEDIISPKPVDDRTEDEIIASIKDRLKKLCGRSEEER